MTCSPVLIDPILSRELGEVDIEAVLIVDAECTPCTFNQLQTALDNTLDFTHRETRLSEVSYFRRHRTTRYAGFDDLSVLGASTVWDLKLDAEIAMSKTVWTGQWIPDSVCEATVAIGRDRPGSLVVYISMPACILLEATGYLDVVEEIYWGYNGRLPHGTRLTYLAADFESVPDRVAEANFNLYKYDDRFLRGIGFDSVTSWQEDRLGSVRWGETLAAIDHFSKELSVVGKLSESRFSILFERNRNNFPEVSDDWMPDLTSLQRGEL